MCVIICKEKNQNKPTKEYLEKSWKHNPDGAGYMIALDDKVIISKGYMTFNSFYKAVEKLPNNKAIVYHFRIATHGAKDERGTHPFPITKSEKLLQKTFVKTNMGVAHNGIIQLCSNYSVEENPYNLSDTQLYIRDYLTKLAEFPNWQKDKIILNIIDKTINSKMAILEPNGTITKIGGFVNVDGYMCSNNYFNFVYDYSYNYNTTLTSNKAVSIDINKYKDTCFLWNSKTDEYHTLDEYKTAKITAYNTLILDNVYCIHWSIFNEKGFELTYEDFVFEGV